MKPKKSIESFILTLRGQKVILDADLAELYGVPTKVFNQAVKRNADRFPEDFMFHLTAQEWSNLKSQIATSSLERPQTEGIVPNWSQFVTSSKRHRGAAYRPAAFTEHGAIMAATILNSPEAVAMPGVLVGCKRERNLPANPGARIFKGTANDSPAPARRAGVRRRRMGEDRVKCHGRLHEVPPIWI